MDLLKFAQTNNSVITNLSPVDNHLCMTIFKCHEPIYEGLMTNDNVQIIGCRQFGGTNIISNYTAHHLIYNKDKANARIYVKSHNTYASALLLSRIRTKVENFYKKYDVTIPAHPIDNKRHLKLYNGNEVTCFNDPEYDFRGVNNIGAIILDDIRHFRQPEKDYDNIKHQSVITPTKIIIVGSRPYLKEDKTDFNLFLVNWYELEHMTTEKVDEIRSLIGDSGFHNEFENIQPFI